MDQSIIKEVKRLQETSNWSELHPELLQCVFDRLSFMSLNQAKSVCSSWYSASKLCVPNQIPWLFLKDYNSSNCVVFVPEEEKVYRIIDLGDDFAQSHCVMTCGSWLLLRRSRKTVGYHYYILNLLTGERIDLPDSEVGSYHFWIDNRSKDYFVVVSGKFTKKGYNDWQKLLLPGCAQILYKNQKIYHRRGEIWEIWDFSREKPLMDGSMSLPDFTIGHNGFPDEHDLEWFQTRMFRARMAVTVSGDFLMVSYKAHRGKPLYFCIYKTNKMNDKWVKIDSLGDKALIYDMGITVNVIANGNIPGIKRNSIYFSNRYDVFVYDLATHKKEPLPEWVLSSMSFDAGATGARWFFPLLAFLIFFGHQSSYGLWSMDTLEETCRPRFTP